MGNIKMTFMKKSKKAIEPAPGRVPVRGATEMPFPHQAGGIIRIFEGIGQGTLGRRQSRFGNKIIASHGIRFMAEPRSGLNTPRSPTCRRGLRWFPIQRGA